MTNKHPSKGVEFKKAISIPPGHFIFTPKYATDKFETGLMDEYLNVFQALRYKPISFLEVGTGQGGSLKFFEDYFSHPNTVISGIDHHLPLKEVSFKKSTQIFVGNQNDSKFLKQIGKDRGRFDIIIDDGAHSFTETQNTYKNLFSFVKPGGYYLIEDWSAELIDSDRFGGMINLVTGIANKHIHLGHETTLKLGRSFSYLIIRKNFTK